jgi:large subunit ribosomal protein L24
MKPTKMRNQLIYRASKTLRSKQISSPLSKDLRKKYSRNSIRVVEGDNVKIMRGEFKGVDGKISRISVENNSIAIEGVKKEKTKGDKFDVFIHPSNVVVTGLNSDDKWRIDRLEGKKPHPKPKESSSNNEKKQSTKTKETKVEKNEKKEVKE